MNWNCINVQCIAAHFGTGPVVCWRTSRLGHTSTLMLSSYPNLMATLLFISLMSLGLLTNFGMYKYVTSLSLFITLNWTICRATCCQMGKYSHSSFGRQKGYPVSVRIANLPTSIRNGEGIAGGHVVGWLPIVRICHCFHFWQPIYHLS